MTRTSFKKECPSQKTGVRAAVLTCGGYSIAIHHREGGGGVHHKAVLLEEIVKAPVCVRVEMDRSTLVLADRRPVISTLAATHHSRRRGNLGAQLQTRRQQT